MKTKILSLIIVASFFFSATAFAQAPKDRNQAKYNPQQRAMMKKNFERQRAERQNFFTEEQQETMKKLRLETAQKIKPLKNEVGELMARQKTLTTVNKADLKAINKNIDQMSAVKTEIAKIMAAQHQQVRALLSDEQLLRFDAMKTKQGQRNGKRNSQKMQQFKKQKFQSKGA